MLVVKALHDRRRDKGALGNRGERQLRSGLCALAKLQLSRVLIREHCVSAPRCAHAEHVHRSVACWNVGNLYACVSVPLRFDLIPNLGPGTGRAFYSALAANW